MQHVPLKSSNVESVAYDPSTREMEIKFLHGKTITYMDVPPHTLTNIQQCRSPGKFVHKILKSNHREKKRD